MSKDSPSTLAELVRRRAAEEPAKLAYRFLEGGDCRRPRELTYSELHERARRIAGRLQESLEPGSRALLLYPPGLDFVAAFYGCSLAAVVAVPAYPPNLRRPHRTFARLQAVIADSKPAAVLTDRVSRRAASGLLPEAPDLASLTWIATDALEAGYAESFRPPAVTPDSLAFLQYTSGSTGSPKGVMVAHRQLLSNLAEFARVTRQSPEGLTVMWLPIFHDMGLIGGVLSALYGNYPLVFMSPLDFFKRPARWLEALSHYRGTCSGAPNFAFDLCARKVRPEQLAELDLSRWRVAVNGSEPVRKATLDRFAATFEPAGFRRQAFLPCYGMAEAVVFISGAPNGKSPTSLRVSAAELQRGRVVETLSDPPEGRDLVACGTVVDGCEVAIVDPRTRRRCDDGRVGEIWFRGPGVAAGYWQRSHETAAVFRGSIAGSENGDRGHFLRTGDLGFLHRGRLFVSGRIREVIIVRGANHYPHDLEQTVEGCHPAIRSSGTGPGTAAAFSIETDGELVLVVAEVHRSFDPDRAEEVFAAVRAAVAEGHQLRLDGIGLLAACSLPKTSSGKVRRLACRRAWRGGTLKTVARWQSRRLTAALAAPATEAPAAEATAAGASAAPTGAEPGMPGPEDPPVRAPANEALERAIHSRLVEILEGDPVDVAKPLTQAGVDSMIAAELHSALRRDLGVDIPPAWFLDELSIREIARRAPAPGALPAPAATAAAHPWESFVNPVFGRRLRRLRMDKRFVEGDGCWLRDADGRRYLEAMSNYGAVPFGHNPREIWRAVGAVFERAEPAMVQPSSLEAAGRLAAALVAAAPGELRYVAFVNSGAEAVEAAIKLTRAATGRMGILSTGGGFHGKTLGALSATPKRAFQEPFGAPVPDFESVPFDDLEALERRLAERGDRFAAFLVEPVQGEGGIVEPRPGYLREALALCRRHGVKLVLDEIQTGLGRTGRLFACEAEGLEPDVLLLAKALGGGIVPLGAVLYTADCYSEEFVTRHSSTFAGNALGCRVGLAVLDLLTRDDQALVRRVDRLGRRLRDALKRLQRRYPRVLRSVRGRGFMLGIELTREREVFGRQSLLGILAEQEKLSMLVASYLLEVEGVRLMPTLLGSAVLRVQPPLTFTEEMCDRLAAAVGRALEHLEAGDTAALVQHLRSRPRPLPERRRTRPHRAPVRLLDAAPRRRWAFVAHPVTTESYRYLDHGLTVFSGAELAELAASWSGLVDPFVAGATRITTDAGDAADGEFIVVPRTAAELTAMPHHRAVAEIGDAVRLARDRGARLVGLGGYTSVLTHGGRDLCDLGVPLTSGNTYTAVVAAATVRRALVALEVPAAATTVAVLGAAGSLGRILSRLLAGDVGRLLLLGNPAHPERSRRQLEEVAAELAAAIRGPGDGAAGPLAERVAHLDGAGPEHLVRDLLAGGLLALSTDADELLPAADVVVTATSSVGGILRPRHFKPGAVVCDVSRPFDVRLEVAEQRPDVLVIEGGTVTVPGKDDLGWDFGLPPRTAFACMCEVAIRCLEGNGSAAAGDALGALELEGAARRHGFSPAAPRSFGELVGDGDWARLRSARGRASRRVS